MKCSAQCAYFQCSAYPNRKQTDGRFIDLRGQGSVLSCDYLGRTMDKISIDIQCECEHFRDKDDIHHWRKSL